MCNDPVEAVVQSKGKERGSKNQDSYAKMSNKASPEWLPKQCA